VNLSVAARIPVRALVVAALLACVSVGALALKPRDRLVNHAARVDFEAEVPRQFGEWQLESAVRPIEPPEVQEKLDRIYDQIVSRTYRNASGDRVMLSIAYGSNQLTEATQVHRPEYCYVAQGFEIVASRPASISGPAGEIDVTRLVAVAGLRQEPITYWLTIGDRAVLPGFGRRMAQWTYALSREIPDGAVVRVSSIGPDWDRQFVLQQKFIDDLFGALKPVMTSKLAGRRT